MHFSSYKPFQENEMCSNMPIERPGACDGTSLRISATYPHHLPPAFDLNNQQNQMMSGYPVSSAIQGEPLCDLLAISTHPVYAGSDATMAGPRPDGENVCEEQFGEGTLVSATVLAGILASRRFFHQNVDGRAFAYNDDPSTSSFNRSSNNGGEAADVWVQQPHQIIFGGSSSSFDPHSTEKGSYQDSWAATYPYHNTVMFNSELSLSLAASQPSRIGQSSISIQDQCSELSRSGITNQHDSGWCSEQSSLANTNDISLTYPSCGTSQPWSASSYLRAAQQLLAELSRFALENVDLGSYSARSPGNVASISGEYSESDGGESPEVTLSPQKRQVRDKKKQLKALLKMVDEGYNQCLRQVLNVVSAFHPLTGSDPEVHARFVLQTTSFLYKSLKERISAQILAADMRSDSIQEQEQAFESSFIHKQWALQQLRRKEHQLWRPQRGLPERSVSVLRAWMFDNFLHPYPKDSEKHMLAIGSGLSRSQVSNWFINARVRLWKPMIEEMYAEINRRKAHRKGHVGENSVRGHSSMGNQRFQCD